MIGVVLRRYVTGILPRYVIGDVLRVFALALVMITSIFVLFMVMAKAVDLGLGLREILQLIPYVIPGTLPYTVPVALLFAVTVVYGRLAADNEIIAVKTAGLSALTVLLPAIWTGLGVSVVLLLLSSDFIPQANHAFKMVLFSDMEDMFYKHLKKEREFNNLEWPFLVTVKDVEGRTLIGPTFKHRAKGVDDPNVFDLSVQADEASISFNFDQGLVEIYLVNAQSLGLESDSGGNFVQISHNKVEIPIPRDREGIASFKRIQEQTNAELDAEQREMLRLMDQERKKQALRAAMEFATGRIWLVDWPQIRHAFYDYAYWKRKSLEIETEKHLRVALACGSFFFVVLGAPVGVLFARRDFLSAFMVCFLPIIAIYYPLTLLGINLGKEGIAPPSIVLLGNVVLGALAGFVALPPVLRH